MNKIEMLLLIHAWANWTAAGFVTGVYLDKISEVLDKGAEWLVDVRR